MKKSEIRHFLNQFISDREYAIEQTEKHDWRIFFTSPHFWIKYISSNIKDVNDMKKIVKFVMTDKSGQFSSISDTIQDVYNNPSAWIGDDPEKPSGGYYTMESVFKRVGNP